VKNVKVTEERGNRRRFSVVWGGSEREWKCGRMEMEAL
jgi:hypothetical protein